MKTQVRLVTLWGLAAVLAACGSGGGGSAPIVTGVIAGVGV
jgi:hypothetical protein